MGRDAPRLALSMLYRMSVYSTLDDTKAPRFELHSTKRLIGQKLGFQWILFHFCSQSLGTSKKVICTSCRKLTRGYCDRMTRRCLAGGAST